MDDVELVIRRAKNAVISRDFNLAIRLYKSLLQEDEKNIQYLSALGNLYIKANDDAKALEYFQTILEHYQNNFEAMNATGGIYRRMGKYQESIDVLKKALQTKINPAQVYYNLGFTYKIMGNYDEAIECFENVIDLNPTDVLAYNHLGAIHASRNEHNEAVAAYRRGLQVDPNHPILHFNMAKSLQALHDDGSAIQSYESALRAKPGWQDAIIAYSELLLEHRKTKAAGELVQSGIGLHPQDAGLYYQMGRVLMCQNNYNKAVTSYEIANRLCSDKTEILKDLATAFEKSGRVEDSVNTINRARKISPEDEGLKKTAASLLLSAEKYEEAEKLIQEMNPAAEKDAEVMDLAGQYSILSGKTEEAASYASKIKALSPEYIAHLYSYATRYVQKGDYEHAKESVKAYIDEKMKDVPAWILLGQIDEAMGNKTEALDDYSTAVAFDPNNHLAGTLAKSLGDKIDAEVSLMEYSRTEDDMQFPDTEEISLDEFDLGGLDEPEEKEEIPATIEGEESEEASDEGLKEENDADILGIDDDSPLFEDTDNEEDPDFINDDSDGIFAEKEAPAEEMPEEEKDEAEEEMPEINIEGADGAEGSGSSGEDAAESAGNFGDENAAEDFEAGETAGEPETADTFAEDAAASAGDGFQPAGSPVNSGVPESSEAPHPSVPDVPVEDITDEKDDVSLDRMLAEDSAKRSSDALKEEAGKISQAVEEAARSAREASAAAEKSWLAAHEAAKSAEMAEKARQKRAEDAYDKLVDQVNDMLPRLKTVLEDVGDAEKFKEEIALFKRLRQLGESLPFEQRAKFLTSRVRLLLDYIISRLSGNPGLLTKATEIRKQTNLPIDGSDSNASINNHNDVINCIKHMESLSFYLKDENLYKALFAAAEEVVEKL